MDKKFMVIIAVMLSVCFFIIFIAQITPQTEEAASPSSSQYVSAFYAERLFDKDKVIDIHISLAKADFEDILANPTKEEYKQASVIINGEEADNVGFRVKGNSSLGSVARSNSQRFSFKLDINQYLDGQNLFGLTKLNLNNSFSDSSYMREYLSYSLLNEMGVPTPAFSYANVYVNDELIGLYLAVEGIEEPFLDRYYGNGEGNLYKSLGGQGSDLLYIDDKRESYSGLVLKTDEKNGADEALLKMIKALNQGQELEKHLDVEEILKYFAVNNVLVNMDSYLGNFNHNYYLYEKNGVFSILPWDYNMSFGGFGMGGGSQSSTSLHIDSPVSGTTLEQRPLLGKLLEVQEYKELYHQYIDELLKGPFSLEEMQEKIEKVAAMIKPHLEKDPTKFYSMEQFELGISDGTQSEIEITASIGLVQFVRERIENVTKQLKGEVPVLANTIKQDNRNVGRGQPGNQQNGQMQPPNGMQPQPNRMQQPLNGRGERNPVMARSAGLHNISLQQMYLVGGSILLMLVVILLVFKRKTKHSI